MKIGKVIGTVVSTRKDEALVGFKLLVIETDDTQERLVAIDTVGAGVGERVLVATGSAARVTLLVHAPVDATVVGIIDTVNL